MVCGVVCRRRGANGPYEAEAGPEAVIRLGADAHAGAAIKTRTPDARLCRAPY